MRNLASLDTRWRFMIAALCASLATLITAVLATRLSHAPLPLSGWWTIATWLLVGSLSAISCVCARDSDHPSAAVNLGLGIVAAAVTTTAVLATTHDAGPAQLAFAWFLSSTGFVVVVGNYARTVFGQPSATSAEATSASETPASAAVTAKVDLSTPSDDDDSEAQSSIALPDHIQQTSSRYLADGRDCLETCLRVQFEPGQQTAVIHLPIQPAMQSDPEVECEPVGGNEVRVAVDPAQPYGIRLVCRRSAPCTDAGESIVAVLISSERLAAAA